LANRWETMQRMLFEQRRTTLLALLLLDRPGRREAAFFYESLPVLLAITARFCRYSA
jgi:hypothetical protein